MTAVAIVPDTDGLAELREVTAGRYQVERELGRGGMAVVYLARDMRLERNVALKLLPPALAAQPELRERFLREARAAASLSHPNIVPIHAVEEHARATYFVMGYVDGETLSERVRRVGPLPVAEVVRVLQDVGWALSYAHARGIVHRDVKGDNILLDRASGRAHVTDFGIARVASSTMTMAGTSMGTPQFMSPEQATGDAVDGRSDLYSLGIVGFFALTGRLPFTAPSAQAIMAMHVTQPAPAVATLRAGVPERVTDAVDRCLRKDPDDRWADADAFVSAIAEAQGSAPAEVAPQIRSYMRIAEASMIQAVSYLVIVPSLALARPAAADMLVLVGVLTPAIVGMQLLSRVRDLVRDGFSASDLVAAYDMELAQREEEMRFLVAARTRDGSIERGKRRATKILVLGILMVVIAIASKHALPPDTLPRVVRRAVASFGGGLIGISFALYAMADPRKERRMMQVIGPRFMRQLSEWLFRRAARSTTRGTVSTARSGDVDAAVEIGRLWDGLPRRTRKAVGEDVPKLAAALDASARAMAERRAQLERSAESAERDTSAPTLAGTGAREARAALDQRRQALAAEMREAAERAGQDAMARMAVIEGLRMALMRLVSGLGRPGELREELGAAKRLLDARNPQDDPA